MRTIAPRFLPALGVVTLTAAVGVLVTTRWLARPPVAGEGTLLGLLALGTVGSLWCWHKGARRLPWPRALAAPTLLRLLTLWILVGVGGWWAIWGVWRGCGGDVAGARLIGLLWLVGCTLGSVCDMVALADRRRELDARKAEQRWSRWVRGLERTYAHSEDLQDQYHRFDGVTHVRLTQFELIGHLRVELAYAFQGLVLDTPWGPDARCTLRLGDLPVLLWNDGTAPAPVLLGGDTVRAVAVRTESPELWEVPLLALLNVAACDKVEWQGDGEVSCLDYCQVEALRDFLSRAWRTTHRKSYPSDGGPPWEQDGVVPVSPPVFDLVGV